MLQQHVARQTYAVGDSTFASSISHSRPGSSSPKPSTDGVIRAARCSGTAFHPVRICPTRTWAGQAAAAAAAEEPAAEPTAAMEAERSEYRVTTRVTQRRIYARL